MPSMEMTRMVSSGTEAVMSAIRLARGYTGKDYIVNLKLLKENKDVYKKIEDSTKFLADVVRKSMGDSACVNQIGSLMSVFFTKENVVDYDSALTSDTEEYTKYFRYMLENGINLEPSQFEAMFISAAHTKEDLEKTAEIIRKYKAV